MSEEESTKKHKPHSYSEFDEKPHFKQGWGNFKFIENHLDPREQESTQDSKQSEKTVFELWSKIKQCLEKIHILVNLGDKDHVLDQNLQKIKEYSKQLGKFTVTKHNKESFEDDLILLKVVNLKAYVTRRKRDESALNNLESVVTNIKYIETFTCDF